MSGAADTSVRTAAAPLPWFRVASALAIILLGIAAYAFNDWRWGTVPDTSWLITVIERIALGQRLYVDVIELNPPFSIWLYMVPVRLAMLLGVAPESAVRLYTILICLTGSALAGWILASGDMVGRRSAVMVTLALFAVAILVSGNSFSERDHVGAVLALPLFVLAAWRALPGRQPTPLHWLAAGAGAGVLAMVKPYYAIIVIGAACMLALKRRDIRTFFLPEFLLSGAITATYLGLSYALHPAYFETLVPLLRDTYMAYRRPFDMMLLTMVPWLALPIVYALLRRLIYRRGPSDFLMLAAAVALLPYFLQGKAWAYHAYPAILFGSAALIVNVAMLFERRATGSKHGDPVVALAAMAVLAAILVAHVRFASAEKPAAALVAAGLETGEAPTVGMLGGAIEVGHPLARLIGGRWIEPYCSDWLATYAVRLRRASADSGDNAGAQRFEGLLSEYFAGKKMRLLQSPPQILIVDRAGRLASEMFGKFGFRELLDLYDRIGAAEGVELHRLKPVVLSSTSTQDLLSSGGERTLHGR
jgi:hypothetical protein